MYNIFMTRLVSIRLINAEKVSFLSSSEKTKLFLQTLISINTTPLYKRLLRIKPFAFSLEIVGSQNMSNFIITADERIVQNIETQIKVFYPLIEIQKITDPIEGLSLGVVNLKLKNDSFYPIATYDKFSDIDPIVSILSILSKAENNETSIVQIALEATDSIWQNKGASYADFGTKNEDGTYTPRSDKSLIIEKISYPGFKVSIRVASTTNKILTELCSSFDIFDLPNGNSIENKKPGLFGSGSFVDDLFERKVVDDNIMNVKELATIWHL